MFIAGKVDTDDLIVSDGSNREQNNDVVQLGCQQKSKKQIVDNDFLVGVVKLLLDLKDKKDHVGGVH